MIKLFKPKILLMLAFVFACIIFRISFAAFTVPVNLQTVASNIINITIMNNLPNNGLITTNISIAIPLNGLNYTAYLNGQETNYEIFNGLTGNILYSWQESGNSNAVSNGIIWISLPAQIAASVNAVNVISIGFAPISTTLMNGNNVGEKSNIAICLCTV